MVITLFLILKTGTQNWTPYDLTYSETKLDKELIKDIKNLKYKLIIITGNAGDGKTAFIHRIESQGTDKKAYDSNNGSCFYLNGVRFESNYDGSQDEDDKANDDVLAEFLAPFTNQTDYTKATEGRVIAINEGVDWLISFLRDRSLKSFKTTLRSTFIKKDM